MQFYLFLYPALVVASLALWWDAHKRPEYAKRPAILLSSIILIGLLGALETVYFLVFDERIQNFFLQGFTALHTLLVFAIFSILEYSVHQQRIEKNQLRRAFRQAFRPVPLLLIVSLLVIGVNVFMAYLGYSNPKLTRVPRNDFQTMVFIVSLLGIGAAALASVGVYGMQGGVIRRKVYPFVLYLISIAVTTVLVFVESAYKLHGLSLIGLGLTLGVYAIRAYHEYFVYRMHHLNDLHRRQIEIDKQRSRVINKILVSTAADDKALLIESMVAFMKQIEENVPSKPQAFKSVVVYHRKGTLLAVQSAEFIYNFCAPLILSDNLKRMNKSELDKHIMSQAFDIEELERQEKEGKKLDFAQRGVLSAMRSKQATSLELPPNLKSMYRKIMLYPIMNQDEIVGMLVLYKDAVEHIFPQEAVILATFVDIFSIMFTIINGKEIQGERNRLSDEMETAKNIQTSILPKTIEIPGYEIVGSMLTATEVGGDLYDYANTSFGNYIDIGDVSGHGLPSGLMALIHLAAFQSAITTCEALKKELTINELYDVINKVLVKINRQRIGSDKFMTGNIFQEKNGTFSHVGAHLPALLYRKAHRKMLELPGMTDRTAFLGISEFVDSKPSVGEFTLDPGDLLILYTDGLVEARDRDGRFFDTDGVTRVVEQLVEAPVEEIRQALLNAVTEFASSGDLKKYGGKFADDISIIVIRRSLI